MRYIKKYFKFLLCLTIIFLAFNLYFIFLLSNIDIEFLIYLDILLGVCIAFFLFLDAHAFYRREREIETYLNMDDFIAMEIDDLEDEKIIQHDFQIFEEKLNDQIRINQDLQDFITKWCHEVKIPLSAAMLMDERGFSFESTTERTVGKNKTIFKLCSCELQGTRSV